eukprot:TRINITY_DN32791_c0_g1_i1.p1 TRINITY_DN32791_c0_g1~~TRINITY_DN32791_c0_g1_i1.p1  ORF type:complete len:232 (+),score=4.70 TRINITY_DN32791_c0_g1_i1:80-775(+)
MIKRQTMDNSTHTFLSNGEQTGTQEGQQLEIQPPKRFPYCIVWTPIPLITWLFPFIGHMGICQSTGEILDFGGSYYINYDNFLFGNPTRYIKLDLQQVQSKQPLTDALSNSEWDLLLQRSIQVYQSRVYNFVGDNCHCFVAHFMNNARYANKQRWNMISLAAMMFIYGKYVSMWGFLYTWIPFIVVIGLGGLFGRFYFLIIYGALLAFLLIVFALVTLGQHMRSSRGNRDS